MSGDAGRLRRRPSERFAGSEHTFDLHQIAKSLLREAHPAKDGHRQMTIYHRDGLGLVLFQFEAGGRLADHAADGVVNIHALSGRLTVTTVGGTNHLSAGQLLVLASGVRHEVYADESSAMLLTIHRGELQPPRRGTARASLKEDRSGRRAGGGSAGVPPKGDREERPSASGPSALLQEHTIQRFSDLRPVRMTGQNQGGPADEAAR